jgi:hypothetical protein
VNSPAGTYLDIGVLKTDWGRGVRVSDLLTHSAGFDDRTIGISARTVETITPLDVYLRRHTPPIVRPPRTVASYSNHGFALAGLIVERIERCNFADCVRANVFAPLGMSHSGFDQPLSASLEAARAIPYRADGSRVPRIYFNDPPASAMYSTAADMGRFMAAFLASDTGGIAGVLAFSGGMRDRQFSHHPALNGLTFGLRERHDNGVRSIEQGGDWDDYSSDLLLSPSSKMGLFVAFSGDAANEVADSAWKLLVADRGVITDARTESVSKGRPVDGVYRLNRFSRHTLARLGVLTGAIREVRVESTSMLSKPLVQVGEDVYRLGAGGQLVASRRGADGRPTHAFFDSSPYVAYERVRWMDRRQLHIAAFVLTFLVLGAILWLAAFRWPLRPTEGDQILRVWRWAMTLAASAGVILIVGIGVIMATFDVNEFQYGLPIRLQTLLSIGALTIPSAGAAFVAAALMWIRPRSTLPSRLACFAGALTAITFAGLVMYWRLIPMV